MDGNDWSEVIATAGVFILVISLVVVGIWQLAATLRARAVLARESQYRQLAEKAVSAQEETARQLADVSGRLAEMQAKMVGMERVLTEVE